jgi:hypothetical protein
LNTFLTPGQVLRLGARAKWYRSGKPLSAFLPKLKLTTTARRWNQFAEYIEIFVWSPVTRRNYVIGIERLT